MERRYLAGTGGIFDGYRWHPPATCLVLDEANRVLAVEQAGPHTNVQRMAGLLVPGLVNAHMHLELAHLRGKIASGTGLPVFLKEVMRHQTIQTEESGYKEAMQQLDKELTEQGVVVAADICNTPNSVPIKASSAIRWYSFIEVAGMDPATALTRTSKALQLRSFFQTMLPGQPRPTLVPHAPYSVSPALWEYLNDASLDQLLTIHNQESPEEDRWIQHGKGPFGDFFDAVGIARKFHIPSGKPSLESWLPRLTKGQQLLLVHNTFMPEASLDFLLDYATGTLRQSPTVVLCPLANQYIEDALPPANMFFDRSVRIALGTDSLASNHTLHMLAEMRALLRLPSRKFNWLDVLHWATLSGAQALRCDDQYGSFEAGKSPGVVLITEADGQGCTAESTSQLVVPTGLTLA
jgi:cytosine/adenosine deaminase-related metal-dependent hydrolase